MANPVFKLSCEILGHFQCGACEKWWSIGDAEVRDYWFCPWCGARNAAADDSPDSPDCDEDGVPYWDVPRGVLPECAAYIAMDMKQGWYGYQQTPVPNLPHRIFLNTSGDMCLGMLEAPYLPDIPADQWHDSLHRVRFVEIPSPVQCECINWARESSSTLSDHHTNCKYAAGSNQRNQSS